MGASIFPYCIVTDEFPPNNFPLNAAFAFVASETLSKFTNAYPLVGIARVDTGLNDLNSSIKFSLLTCIPLASNINSDGVGVSEFPAFASASSKPGYVKVTIM